MIRLKINFHKSFVYNLSGSEEVITRVTSILSITNLATCFSLILGSQSDQPLLQRKIGNHLLRGSKKDLQLEKVMPFLEKVGASLWILSCHLCHSTTRSFTFFLNGWSMVLIVFVMHSFERALGVYTEGFAWLIGNLFALIRTNVVWVFAISGLSILLFYPSAGEDSSMIIMLHGWALLSTIIIEGVELTTCTSPYPGIFPLFGEES